MATSDGFPTHGALALLCLFIHHRLVKRNVENVSNTVLPDSDPPW